jgi:anti-sigma factor RsiW
MMCREVTELLTDAMEGTLPPGKKAGYRFHVALCPYCKAHRRQVEATIATLRALPAPPPSDEARDRAMAAFRAARRGTTGNDPV